MKKYLFSPLLGLFIIIGSITIATPANAGQYGFQLRNYQTGLCLDAAGWSGEGLQTFPCNSIDHFEYWGQITVGTTSDGYLTNFTSNGDFYLVSLTYGTWSYRSPTYVLWSDLVIGVQAAVMANGTPFILWPDTYDYNQQWSSVYIGPDLGGHPCYILENKGGTSAGLPFVMGVAGGNPNQGTQIILWRLFVDQYGNPDFHGHPDQYWCVY